MELVNGQQYYVYTGEVWDQLQGLLEADPSDEIAELLTHFEPYGDFYVYNGDDDLTDMLWLFEDYDDLAPGYATYILSTQSFSGDF